MDSTTRKAILCGILVGFCLFVFRLFTNSFDILEVARNGAVAGALHACTGPDHFSAILPGIAGKYV